MRCSRVLLAARALGSCALLAGARGPCRVGAGWRPFARRLAPFPPSGAQEGAFPLFPRRALKGALCGRFNWGDKGFAQGPRATRARVVAGRARALPRRAVCGRLRLRLRGLWPLLASRAPPLRRAPGPVGVRCAHPPALRAIGHDRGKQLPDPSNHHRPDAAQTPQTGLPGL